MTKKLKDTQYKVINGELVIDNMDDLMGFVIFCVYPELFRPPFKRVKRTLKKNKGVRI